MNKKWIIVFGALGVGGVLFLILLFSVIGTANSETDLSTAIHAKQTDNKNAMDKMWKTISQVAQVTEGQKNALMEIFTGYAQARAGGKAGGGGSLATWIHEAIPSVDTSTFNNLQNIITSERDGFYMRQKELLDLNREHNRLLQRIPSGWILAAMGRKEIDVTIVTSSRTETAFQTGKDDDVSVFGNNQPAQKPAIEAPKK
jgi:hypothetical protein